MAVVEIRGLVKRYGAVTALRGVDLTVEEGEIFGLLGPNGAGKTTTVEILAGLRSRDAGQVSVLGLDPAIDRRRLSWLLALQPQRFEFLEDTTVAEIVAAYASLYGERRSGRIEQLLERVGLADRRRARFQHLSGGQRQRLNICLALIGNPRLIVLDEPTTGLDPQARFQIHAFIEEIRKEGRTVILTTHYLEEAEKLCDRVAIVDEGRVLACERPRELIRQFGGQTRIEFACATAGLAPDGWPGVVRVLGQAPAWTVWSTDTGATLAALFHAARSCGAHIERVEIRPPTLEDVFIQLTGHHFRN